MAIRVLIIEDNPANLLLMQYLLDSRGCKTSSARDGLLGAALIREEQPDLVICDIHLPGLDGYGIMEQVRINPVLSRIPVIAVTAFARGEDRERIERCGFRGYLSKPIAPESFVDEILAFMVEAGAFTGKH